MILYKGIQIRLKTKLCKRWEMKLIFTNWKGKKEKENILLMKVDKKLEIIGLKMAKGKNMLKKTNLKFFGTIYRHEKNNL